MIKVGQVRLTESDAALYQLPFEYVNEKVRPLRLKNNRKLYRDLWWIHGEPRPALRKAIGGLTRYIVTPRVAKHRLFVWVSAEVLPDSAVIAIARDDDYFFGVLHSRLHEVWALKMGTALEDRPRYTPTSTFETFPLPWTPRNEPKDDPRLEAIAMAARDLVIKRDTWLNPSGASATELKKRTLTNLYNESPTWLQNAHRTLDDAVLAAYGWPKDLADQEILARLLQLNVERFAQQQPVLV